MSKKRKPLTAEQRTRKNAKARVRREQMTPEQKEYEAIQRRVQRGANRVYINAKQRTWRKQNPSWVMWHTAKRRAKQWGILFDLKVADIVIPKHCPVFGIPLQIGISRSGPNSPTLDRIDATRGYVKGNVAVISQFANSLKGKATAAQHHRIADWMLSVAGSAP